MRRTKSLVPESRFVNWGLEGMVFTLPDGKKLDEEKGKKIIEETEEPKTKA